MLEKTLESPLDCKEIQPVHPKGEQSWMFNGRTEAEAETPIFCNLMQRTDLLEKTLMLKRMTEDEMVRWHHRLDGHGFGWAPGVGDGQESSPWGCKGLDMTEQLN